MLLREIWGTKSLREMKLTCGKGNNYVVNGYTKFERSTYWQNIYPMAIMGHIPLWVKKWTWISEQDSQSPQFHRIYILMA